MAPSVTRQCMFDRATRESGELAGFDRQRLAADLRLERMRQGDISSWCVEEVTTCGLVSLTARG